MYLQKSDYQIRIRRNLLDVLLENIAGVDPGNPTPGDILEAADKIASDTIATKAGVLYDIDGELAKTGDNRNGYIISQALSIAIYELYQRTDDYDIPDKVIKNYNDTINILDEVSRGKEPLNLPPKPSGDNGENNDGEHVSSSGFGLRRLGSAKKRSHRI
ncbi:MAG: DUF1320 family protein [Sphingobacteriales bacterium]|nr:DUF1320 family protein [Sphingobacteriales bacterium]